MCNKITSQNIACVRTPNRKGKTKNTISSLAEITYTNNTYKQAHPQPPSTIHQRTRRIIDATPWRPRLTAPVVASPMDAPSHRHPTHSHHLHHHHCSWKAVQGRQHAPATMGASTPHHPAAAVRMRCCHPIHSHLHHSHPGHSHRPAGGVGHPLPPVVAIRTKEGYVHDEGGAMGRHHDEGMSLGWEMSLEWVSWNV